MTCRLILSQQENGRRAAWSGTVSAEEPIVAMSFFSYGDKVDWARSPTRLATELPVELFLRPATTGELHVTWRIADAQTHLGLEGVTITAPPTRIELEVVTGELFRLADLAPSVSLFGLVLPKTQVRGKRTHLWELKDKYLGGLPPVWKQIMMRGRAGTLANDSGDGA